LRDKQAQLTRIGKNRVPRPVRKPLWMKTKSLMSFPNGLEFLL
jgi:hypothetical protein